MYERLLREENERDEGASFMGYSQANDSGPSLARTRMGEEPEDGLLPERQVRPDRWLTGHEFVAWVFERACNRKSNLNKEEADRIVDDHASQGRLMYYYKCQMCCSYHLTKQPSVSDQRLNII